MKQLSETLLAKLNFTRIREHRRSVIANINKKSTNGKWCCESKCEWVINENFEYPEQAEDYAYLRLVNHYYNITLEKAKETKRLLMEKQ